MTELEIDLYPPPKHNPTVTCPLCGRFAKFLWQHRVMMGEYEEWQVGVRCSKCGEQAIY